jgi:hypothetical protein
MMYMCASKFELEEKQLTIISEFLFDKDKEQVNKKKIYYLLIILI